MAAAILTYHSLDESGSAISTPPALFRRQIETLLAQGTRFVPLEKSASGDQGLALTFDDGFASFLDHALPVLERHALPATVFVVAGYCGRSNDWLSQPSWVPRLPLMTWRDLESISGGLIQLGCHTMTHPFLTQLATDEAEEEIVQAEREIEDRTGRGVASFAYPYGALSADIRGIVKRHFAIGCGTRLALVEAGADPMELPRVDAYYLKKMWLTRRLFSAPARQYLAFRRVLRAARTQTGGMWQNGS
jgi:peptidoglycan/xylan/chitin deacetylase (PgdA/CDA1 family)